MRPDRAQRLLKRIEARHTPKQREPSFADYINDEIAKITPSSTFHDALEAYWRACQLFRGEPPLPMPPELVPYAQEYFMRGRDVTFVSKEP